MFARAGRKEGFTLVELAIVLVIIGLLIGGILVAQSMVRTAKIQAFIRQIDQFDVAITNFQTKYNSLPGDTRFFANPGNGNGIIEDSNMLAGNSWVARFDQEVANAWTHLSSDGFMPDNIVYSNDASSGIKAGINTPVAKLGKALNGKGPAVIIYRDSTQPHESYWIADFSKTSSTFFNDYSLYTSVFTPMEALAIDTKIDDGIANNIAGNSSVGSGGIVGAWTTPAPDGTRCFNNSGVYLTNNNLECMLFIRVTRVQGGTP